MNLIMQPLTPRSTVCVQSHAPVPSIWKKVYNFFSMIWAAAKSLLHLTKYRIVQIDVDHIPLEFREKLKRFEASFTYPFNEREQFRIEHGKNGDYFAFFKRLGKVHCYIAMDGGKIAAMGTGVLRTVMSNSGKPVKTWYICDVKVGKDYRGEHLPLMLFQRAAWRYIQAPRGYGICMNPPDRPPKAAEIWKHHSPMKGLNGKTLNFYTLTAEQAASHWREIEACFGKKFTLTSTKGAKDYQIFGPGGKRPWHLLHFAPGERESAPESGATHMLSALDGTLRDTSLKRLLGSPTSTAEIVSFGMDPIGFDFLTTDQI